MMRGARQLGNRLEAGSGLRAGGGAWMVLLLLLAGLPLGAARAQNPTPMPVTTAAPPPLPVLPAGATPSVAQSQAPATMMVLPKLPGMPPVEGEQTRTAIAEYPLHA